jgi:hypothetical protein
MARAAAANDRSSATFAKIASPRNPAASISTLLQR